MKLKNLITQLKNSDESLPSRLDQAQDRVSGLEKVKELDCAYLECEK